MAAVTHGPADDGATLMPYQYFCLINISARGTFIEE
jgi:hypothetical protein